MPQRNGWLYTRKLKKVLVPLSAYRKPRENTLIFLISEIFVLTDFLSLLQSLLLGPLGDCLLPGMDLCLTERFFSKTNFQFLSNLPALCLTRVGFLPTFMGLVNMLKRWSSSIGFLEFTCQLIFIGSSWETLIYQGSL